MVKGDKAFEWSMLKDSRFLRIFAIVVFMHAMWNTEWPQVLGLPFAQICLTAISWIIAMGVMNASLKEITGFKQIQMEQATVIPLHNSISEQNYKM